MEQQITFRAVIEILGKPQEHVESSLKEYVKKLKEDKQYKVVSEDLAEAKKQEDQELWATFAELEVETGKLENLTAFCFDYMPSLLEIIEPKQIALSDTIVSAFLNDLQARLHQVDMIAKQVRMENDILKKNVNALLRNYVVLLLKKTNLTAQQLSKLTGVPQDELEDFLDNLIDQGRIDLKEGIYFLAKENKTENVST